MCERKKYSFDSAIYHVEEIKNTVNKGIKSNDRITDEKREEYRREAREWKERKDREMSDWEYSRHIRAGCGQLPHSSPIVQSCCKKDIKKQYPPHLADGYVS
ncbi:hypothetical protein M9434_005946 [Picochlorum sp. BPE23]|nr:hypothetical protein M9434_005611 [Picochlorum sp. BPE23]KAI8103163.1 hypothetical protein M9434_005946 [Picochlorum sp. BPE23]